MIKKSLSVCVLILTFASCMQDKALKDRGEEVSR